MNRGPDRMRRVLLKIIVAGAGASVVVPVLAGGGPEARRIPALGRLFKDPAIARKLGAIYLAHRPEEAFPERLLERIFVEGAWDIDRLNSLSQPELRAELQHRCRRDFELERIVDVDGWQLSHAEARIYALTFLGG